MIDKSLRVLNVKYIDEYKLKVKFSDGNTKLIDLKEYLEKNKNTVFEPLLDKTLFKEAYVDFTVCWPNEIDIAPEVLYELGSSLEKEKINPKILALVGLIKNEEVFDMELGDKMVEVIGVRYIEEYKLDLTFSNNVSKIVDLKEKILLGKGPMYEPLKDIEYFKKVRVDKELGTVVWPNEFDICPDSLYEM